MSLIHSVRNESSFPGHTLTSECAAIAQWSLLVKMNEFDVDIILVSLWWDFDQETYRISVLIKSFDFITDINYQLGP